MGVKVTTDGTNGFHSFGAFTISKKPTKQAMEVPEESGPDVFVYDIRHSRTARMSKHEIEAKLEDNPVQVQTVPIQWNKAKVAVWSGDESMELPQEWLASVHIPWSIRIQRVFGRFKTLYVTTNS